MKIYLFDSFLLCVPLTALASQYGRCGGEIVGMVLVLDLPVHLRALLLHLDGPDLAV